MSSGCHSRPRRPAGPAARQGRAGHPRREGSGTAGQGKGICSVWYGREWGWRGCFCRGRGAGGAVRLRSPLCVHTVLVTGMGQWPVTPANCKFSVNRSNRVGKMYLADGKKKAAGGINAQVGTPGGDFAGIFGASFKKWQLNLKLDKSYFNNCPVFFGHPTDFPRAVLLKAPKKPRTLDKFGAKRYNYFVPGAVLTEKRKKWRLWPRVFDFATGAPAGFISCFGAAAP